MCYTADRRPDPLLNRLRELTGRDRMEHRASCRTTDVRCLQPFRARRGRRRSVKHHRYRFGGRLVAGHELSHGRDVRQLLRAGRGRHRQRAQSTSPDIPDRFDSAGEHDLHLPGDEISDRRPATAVLSRMKLKLSLSYNVALIASYQTPEGRCMSPLNAATGFGDQPPRSPSTLLL